MIWPAFEVKAKLESFSGHDPLWKMARGIQWWEESLEILTNSSPSDLLVMDESTEMPWLTVDHSTLLFPILATQAIERYQLRPIIEAVKEIRCIEDFDARSSRAKIDFYRKWYHSQTKHPMISLEGFLKQTGKSGNVDSLGPMRRAADTQESLEESIFRCLDAESFLQALPDQDREIIELRKQGWTQGEIAEHLKYHTHSAVSKRIAAIAQRYRDFLSDP